MTDIHEQLAKIEAEKDVSILFACEAGSRAWGFESPDSDYDVRFIYVHPKDWYFSINVENRRDVIEYPIVDDYDISGWDLRKALKLLRKSNPSLLEWIYSPIIYLDMDEIASELAGLADVCFHMTSVAYHYHGMAYRNYREYLKGGSVWVKKYLYVIRPILSIMWLKEYNTHPPVEFAALRSGVSVPNTINDAIDRVLEFKLANKEKAFGASIPELNEFIEGKFENQDYRRGRLTPFVDITELDDLFIRSIEG